MTKAETEILEFLHKNPGASGSAIRHEIVFRQKIISANNIHQVFRHMQAEGLIHRKGNSSGARWYVGADEINKRNDVMNRLRGLAADMRKTSILVAEFSPNNGEQMRGAAMMMEQWVKALGDTP